MKDRSKRICLFMQTCVFLFGMIAMALLFEASDYISSRIWRLSMESWNLGALTMLRRSCFAMKMRKGRSRMKKVTGYKSFAEWKRYLHQKKNAIRRKKDRALLITAVPAMTTVLISACGTEAYIPWLGLGVGNLFYFVLAFVALMSIVMWQIVARPEMNMKNRFLLNILPAELLLWLHLCRKDYQAAMTSAYIALGVMMIAAIHDFFCKQCKDLKNRVCIIGRKLGLLVMMIMIVPSVLSVCSQIRCLLPWQRDLPIPFPTEVHLLQLMKITLMQLFSPKKM